MFEIEQFNVIAQGCKKSYLSFKGQCLIHAWLPRHSEAFMPLAGQHTSGTGIHSHWVQAADEVQSRVFSFLSSGPSSSKMPLGLQQATSWCSHVQCLPGLCAAARRDWGPWLLSPLACAGLCSDSWGAAVWPQTWEELSFLFLKSLLNLRQHQCGPWTYPSQQVLFF